MIASLPSCRRFCYGYPASSARQTPLTLRLRAEMAASPRSPDCRFVGRLRGKLTASPSPFPHPVPISASVHEGAQGRRSIISGSAWPSTMLPSYWSSRWEVFSPIVCCDPLRRNQPSPTRLAARAPTAIIRFSSPPAETTEMDAPRARTARAREHASTATATTRHHTVPCQPPQPTSV
jgi:hypothetical protein